VKRSDPARGRATADGLNVEDKSTETGGHDDAAALTAKQRKRYSPLSVNGILARPASTAQAHDLAMALGKTMRRDGTFEELRHGDDMVCVEVRPSHRDKVLSLLGLSPWSWGEYVRRLEAAGMAHRCPDLKRGAVRLLLEPASICPVPMCGEVLPSATVERGSQQRSTLPTATENVLAAGDASRDEKGDVPSQRSTNGDEAQALEGLHVTGEPSSPVEQPSEVAAHDALKRAGVEIGEPMTDEEIRALGYRRTSRGWVPIKGVTDAA